MRAHREEPIPPLPAELPTRRPSGRRVRALQKRPEDRFATAGGMAVALAALE